MATRDYDFIGFTFGGKHSIDDFGIYRTSDGDRYNDNLIPSLNDRVADIPGGNGQYYFGSTYKNRQFNISIAFDHLTEEQYVNVRKWLKGDAIQDLVFDETPYKVYSAKVTSTPSLKTICFEENGERIYKGEGSIQFTCYYPFAHTPTKTKSNQDGRSANSYTSRHYPTYDQWKSGSNLMPVHKDGRNKGDIPAPFVIKTNKTFLQNIKKGDKFKVGALEVTILEDCSLGDLIWDSNTGLITFTKLKQTKLVKFSGQSYGTIPPDPNDLSFQKIAYCTTEGEGEEKVEIEHYLDGTKKRDGKMVVDGDGNPVVDRVLFSIEYNYWYY